MAYQTRAPDRAALSGLISGIAFVAGVFGGVATSKAPFPIPGSSDAEKIRRFPRQRSLGSALRDN